MTTSGPPLSALELSMVNVDQTTRDALHDTIVTAQVVDELGFYRLWVRCRPEVAYVSRTGRALVGVNQAVGSCIKSTQLPSGSSRTATVRSPNSRTGTAVL